MSADQATDQDVEAAIGLLRERRRTNGWADLGDLLDACGRSGTPLDHAQFCRSLHSRICSPTRTERVAYTPPIGLDEPGKYRLITPTQEC